MSSELLSQEQIDAGYQRFLKEDPQARALVAEQTQQMADILGVELTVLRRDETAKALRERATALGVDSFEYLLQFAVETDEMRQKILQARSESVDRVLGQKW
ncbi:MAG: DUF6388 family protein [Comamonas sp.]|uniref:DUF6388 family protein n=1 Tax=Comamonas sp. TaxID=34028 RepID=UPI003D147BE4